MRTLKTFAVLVALPCAALLGLWLVKMRHREPVRVSESVGEDLWDWAERQPHVETDGTTELKGNATITFGPYPEWHPWQREPWHEGWKIAD